VSQNRETEPEVRMTLGRLVRSRKQPQLVFTRPLSHPPEKVWRALTQPEHVRRWFPDNIEGDFEPGGKLRFFSDNHDFDFDGEVLAFEPPRVLEIRWGTDRLRFELQPDGTGTLLTMTDTFDELGKAARDGAGWHECLDWFEAELAGTEPDFAPGQRWGEVHGQYVAAFGPDAATIGPPEGPDARG
jgi:uncharacterized protein YndB with AHSA1/START domain